jgi:Restriction endonuclease
VSEEEVLDEDETVAGPAMPFEATEVAQTIASSDTDWSIGETVDFGGTTWRPHLAKEMKDGKRAVLYVHLSDRLRSFASSRLQVAFEAGVEIHIAIPESHLYDEELLEILAGLDAQVHVIKASDDVAEPERVLALLGDRQVTVTTTTRTAIAVRYLELCRVDAEAHTKGRRFEALLAFLFSQVGDFVIRSRNYRTATEEIDIVIQQRATQGRAWAILMAPFILIEAKNRKEGVSQEMTSAFLLKMQGKRGTVRLGFVASTTTVSGDAIAQELRFAAKDVTVVFLEYEDLKAWCAAEDPDDHLEDVVSRAMLR